MHLRETDSMMELNRKRNHNGITLIALIITIIVLLILAGISISLVVGDNGVLTRAQTSKVKTDEATIKEELELSYTTVLSKYYEELSNDAGLNKVTFIGNNLQTELTKQDGSDQDIIGIRPIVEIPLQ